MTTVNTSMDFQLFLDQIFNFYPDIELKSDLLSLGLYATDASLYQVKPIGVYVPKNTVELSDVVKLATKYRVPILPRGSATSLAGQTTNYALVIDFTKYFDQILDINPSERYAIVQPGVVRDQLNLALLTESLHFAPDPATTSRATIGGMIANNSSGTKSIKYGKTIDHIISLKIMLSDGHIYEMRQTSMEQWDIIAAQQDREGEIYRTFRQLIFAHSEAIAIAFPKVMRRVQGYPLDEFLMDDDWNIAKIFSGSEGSLGIIIEAKVNLEPIPKYKAALTLHYHDRMEAIREVNQMVVFDPAAIEMLDYNVFNQSKKNRITKPLYDLLIIGDPQATLSVEFFCLSQNELDTKLSDFKVWLSTHSRAYAYRELRTAQELDASWSLRKNGLGLLMGDPNGRKPMPFIEDMAIPLEDLADYIADVLALCDANGVETILYAHASVGVLHVRPALDMTVQSDIDLMKKISDEVFILVKKYKGSWSGEHGDGRNRGHKLREYFGEEVFGCLLEVKNLFDPQNIFNPTMIVDVPPMDTHLRYGADYNEQRYKFVYKYRTDNSFQSLVHNCSGVGACRNHIGGTMCPSFKATLDEKDSTRGRANALRLGMSEGLGFESLTDDKVLDTLDLCLSCKACKSECPSNVDMAKLKSEVLQLKYDTKGTSLREKVLNANIDMTPKIAGTLAKLVNPTQHTKVFRYVMEQAVGIDRRRILPDYAEQTLSNWYKKNYVTKPEWTKKIGLFADTYINYHELEIGRSAIALLNSCGYDVVLVEVGCCQRPRISNGFLNKAKVEGTKMADLLQPYLDSGLQIVVCEPSCTSALIDDLPDLMENERLGISMKINIMAIDEFLGKELENGNIKGRFEYKNPEVLIHNHCHQKAVFGTKGLEAINRNAATQSTKISCPEMGCCGMAGAFGYEKEHFDISKKIANLVLLPTIAATSVSSLIISNGFSCRHQIKDFSDRKALHFVQAIRFIQGK